MLWVASSFFTVAIWIITVIWHALFVQAIAKISSWIKRTAADNLPKNRVTKKWKKKARVPTRRRSRRNDTAEQAWLFPDSTGGPTMRGGLGTPNQELYGSGGIFRGETDSSPSISTGEGAIMRPEDFHQVAQQPSSSRNSTPRIQRGYQEVSQGPIMRADDFPNHLSPEYQASPALIHRPQDFDLGIRQRQNNVENNTDPFSDSGHIFRGPNQLRFPRDTAYHGVQLDEEEEEDEEADGRAVILPL